MKLVYEFDWFVVRGEGRQIRRKERVTANVEDGEELPAEGKEFLAGKEFED